MTRAGASHTAQDYEDWAGRELEAAEAMDFLPSVYDYKDRESVKDWIERWYGHKDAPIYGGQADALTEQIEARFSWQEAGGRPLYLPRVAGPPTRFAFSRGPGAPHGGLFGVERASEIYRLRTGKEPPKFGQPRP